MTAYQDLTAAAGNPGGFYIGPGDYLVSPGGAYTAFVTSADQLVVSRGSTPSTLPSAIAWETPALQTVPSNAQPALGVFGNTGFGLYDFSQNPSDPILQLHGGDNNSFPGATVSLSDSGALTLNQGSPQKPGPQLYSNNVNDPITGIQLSGITYNLANPTILTTTPVTSLTARPENATSTTQLYPTGVTLNYTKTSSWNWSVSQAVALNISSKSSIGIPGLGKSELGLSITSTTTYTDGRSGSDAVSKTFAAANNVTVPPFSIYQVQLTATAQNYDVPYTYDGIATYQSGATAEVHGTGEFSGSDTGVFSIVTTCVSTPGGCPSGPIDVEPAIGTESVNTGFVVGGAGSGLPVGAPAPVPEPASLPLLPAALMATAVIRRVRTRRLHRDARSTPCVAAGTPVRLPVPTL